MAKKRPAEKAVAKAAKKQKSDSKRIAQQSPESVHDEAPAKKVAQAPKKAKGASDINIFSPSFNKRLNEFKELYQDYLDVRSRLSDIIIDKEFQKVTHQVSSNIQKEALQIFKTQLQSQETWIANEITKINGQIDSVNQVYEKSRESLLKTGAFSEEEVKKQLIPVQTKVTEKKKIREKYEQLRARAKQIYTEPTSAVDDLGVIEE